MSDYKEYVVCLKQGEDVTSFREDMETPGGALYIPNRSVTSTFKVGISRNTTYLLTKEEALTLAEDQRVLFVEPKLPMMVTPHYTKTAQIFSSILSPNHLAWGKYRTAARQASSNIYTFNTTRLGSINAGFGSYRNGKDIDVVLFDDLILSSHPDFNDAYGQSRVIKYNWHAHAASVGFTEKIGQQYGYARNWNDNHGTSTASIMAGLRYGWAPEANIYNIRGLGNGSDRYDSIAYGATGSIEGAMWYIYYFHINKPLHSTWGNRNPTIVNASLGYQYWVTTGSNLSASSRTENSTFSFPTVVNIVGANGVTYNNPGNWSLATLRDDPFRINLLNGNMANGGDGQLYWLIEAWAPWIEQDFVTQQNLTSGIVWTASAGNNRQYYATPSDPYYNVRVNFTDGGWLYPNRGSMPASASTSVMVAASEYYDRPANFTARGSRPDVFAPTFSMAAYTNTSYNYYPTNSSYGITIFSGTSNSSPETAGVIALWAQQQRETGNYSSINGATARNLFSNGTLSVAQLQSGGGPWYNEYSSQYSNNRILAAASSSNARTVIPTPVTASSIQTELGGGNPIAISEYVDATPKTYGSLAYASSSNITDEEFDIVSITVTPSTNGGEYNITVKSNITAPSNIIISITASNYVAGAGAGAGTLTNFETVIIKQGYKVAIKSGKLNPYQVGNIGLTTVAYYGWKQLTSRSTTWLIGANNVAATYNKEFYSLSPNTTTVAQGSQVTFTVYTINVPNQTLYWSTSNGASVNSDFTATSGSFSLANGTGTITITTTNTNTIIADRSKSFAVDIRTSSGGPIVATSKVVNILNSGQKVTQVYSYTGSSQSFVVPSGVTRVTFKLWGAGGSGRDHYGGNGGYTQSTLAVQAGQVFSINPGEASWIRDGSTNYGGGRRSYYDGDNGGGDGGGRSWITRSGISGDILTAGGGGGGGSFGTSTSENSTVIASTFTNGGGSGGGLIAGSSPDMRGGGGGTQSGASGKIWGYIGNGSGIGYDQDNNYIIIPSGGVSAYQAYGIQYLGGGTSTGWTGGGGGGGYYGGNAGFGTDYGYANYMSHGGGGGGSGWVGRNGSSILTGTNYATLSDYGNVINLMDASGRTDSNTGIVYYNTACVQSPAAPGLVANSLDSDYGSNAGRGSVQTTPGHGRIVVIYYV